MRARVGRVSAGQGADRLEERPRCASSLRISKRCGETAAAADRPSAGEVGRRGLRLL